jgi:hypothetical protein
MIGSPPPPPPPPSPPPTPPSGFGNRYGNKDDQQPFLRTTRAFASCAREFTRLSTGVAEAIVDTFGEIGPEKIIVRQSPERCIVQVGGAALTMAWLRSTHDSVAEGELLVILWRGIVAPTLRFKPERLTDPVAITATAINETVFVADATCEADWMWRSRQSTSERYTSANLARAIADQLRAIHHDLRESA